jgi:4-hydroxythreonine-4-phosphate dehydrogenase
MKVYVSQGHEAGIGLEVFFKSCLLLSSDELSKITLVAYPDSVHQTLNFLKIPHQILEDTLVLTNLILSSVWLSDVDHSESFTALNLAMKLAETGGVLYTLPTSKDQFPGFAGHTEYFRKFYNRPELGMFFSSSRMQVLLISDHLPVSALSEALTEDVIAKRLHEAVLTLTKWNWPIKRILISGLNPHAGEKGIIGHEDERITHVMKRLSPHFKFPITGPYPGDTMALEQNDPRDLLVYMFHDQGLGVFKGLQGFVGSNITLGLPYPRFSPDHGTSFSLFGKNLADYRGCSFSLKQAIGMLEGTSHGKNSSHQS